MRFDERPVLRYVMPMLFAAALAGPGAAQTAPAVTDGSGSAVASRSSIPTVIRIDNFGRISANYYRGAQPRASDYTDLAALGVKTAIDLQADGDNRDEAELVQAAGLNFHRIPMTTHVPPDAEQIATFLKIVNDPA